MQAMEAVRAGLLVRISDDRLGDAAGVERQKADGLALSDRNGWHVTEVYVENDTSAYQRRIVTLPDGTRARRVIRPEYRRMLDDLTSGKINALVAYDLDRVARDPRDLEDLIDVVESRRVLTASVTGNLDLSTNDGVFMARMMVNVANKSSRDTSRRVKRKLEQNAAEGRPHGGSRPYGWLPDRITLDPAEAAHVRRAVELLLGGHSVKAVVRSLHESGSRNSLGDPWRDVTVRTMLLRPRNAGLRQHHGRIIGEGTWERVRVLLLDPSRRTTPGGSGRTALLSGIAVCAICEGLLRGSKGKPYKGVAGLIYRCGRGCVTVGRGPLEALIVDLVCARLAEPDAADLFTEPDDAAAQEARAELEELQARLASFDLDRAEGRIDRDQHLRMTASLRPKIEAARRRVHVPTTRPMLVDELLAADDVREHFDGLDPSVQRRILGALVTVRVGHGRRGPGFDASRVEVDWLG